MRCLAIDVKWPSVAHSLHRDFDGACRLAFEQQLAAFLVGHQSRTAAHRVARHIVGRSVYLASMRVVRAQAETSPTVRGGRMAGAGEVLAAADAKCAASHTAIMLFAVVRAGVRP